MHAAARTALHSPTWPGSPAPPAPRQTTRRPARRPARAPHPRSPDSVRRPRPPGLAAGSDPHVHRRSVPSHARVRTPHRLHNSDYSDKTTLEPAALELIYRAVLCLRLHTQPRRALLVAACSSLPARPGNHVPVRWNHRGLAARIYSSNAASPRRACGLGRSPALRAHMRCPSLSPMGACTHRRLPRSRRSRVPLLPHGAQCCLPQCCLVPQCCLRRPAASAGSRGATPGSPPGRRRSAGR